MLAQVLQGSFVKRGPHQADLYWGSLSWQQSQMFKVMAIEQLQLSQLWCDQLKVIEAVRAVQSKCCAVWHVELLLCISEAPQLIA